MIPLGADSRQADCPLKDELTQQIQLTTRKGSVPSMIVGQQDVTNRGFSFVSYSENTSPAPRRTMVRIYLPNQMGVPFRYLSLTQSVQKDFLLLAMSQSCFMRAAVFQSSNLLIPNPPYFLGLQTVFQLMGWSLRWSILPLQRTCLAYFQTFQRRPASS